MNILYENIKQRRIGLKMSQEELANKTGYTSRSSIAKIEKGEVDLTQTKINLFAKALGTTPAELMGWEETKRENDRLAAVAVRLKKDEVFQKAVLSINDLPIEKIIALQAVIDALN